MDNNNEDQDQDIDQAQGENPKSYINLPKKTKYRMHAHCNPLAAVSIPYPYGPNKVDWGVHYPSKLNKSSSNTNTNKLQINTYKFPIEYFNQDYEPIATSNLPKDFNLHPQVTIVDIGCGYGGLLFNMSPHLQEGQLAIGMEIRDKVSNYVGERINTLRLNSSNKECTNISIIRTNTMKLLLNYFYKGQLDKLLFCFADPHFKKYNHRKRIINKYLLNDYSYVLKKGGKLYSITDVEELHQWHVEVLAQNPCFKPIDISEVEKDPFLAYMKNTDEARKVIKKKGKMFYCVYERVVPAIKTIKELYETIKVSQLE